MESAHSHTQLAEALADAFTVYLPDRRGRGLSGPYGKDYSIQIEVEDMDALLTKTDAHYVFVVSAGGLICLQAALHLPAIHKAALYEPALIVNGSISTAFLPRYDKEMAQDKVAAALVTAMKGAQMGPPIFNAIPSFLLELLTNMAMKSEDKKARSGDVTMRMLAPTLHYDFQLVDETAEALENFRKKAYKEHVAIPDEGRRSEVESMLQMPSVRVEPSAGGSCHLNTRILGLRCPGYRNS